MPRDSASGDGPTVDVSGEATLPAAGRGAAHVSGDGPTVNVNANATTGASVDETLPAASAGLVTRAQLPRVDDASYEVLEEYARGGLGRIIKARDRRTGRLVAIKQMLTGSPDAAARFAREALITANLQHPAIVPVYEVGRFASGEPFYAMKLVAGRSLAEAVAATHALDARLALLPHVIAVADALAYAHGQGVVHRDLKPANVLVGDFGETVVIDWGLAKRRGERDAPAAPAARAPLTEGGETQLGAVMGTPAYMPPEQAEGREVDARADVYALGAMLYHLLTGRPPFHDSKSADDTLARVMTGKLRPLRALVPQLAPDLAAIVDKAMAFEAADRYPTARELAEDLRRFHLGKLVTAHHYTRGQRLRRWIAARRGAVAVGALATVALIAGGVLSFDRIVRERDLARSQERLASSARDDAEQQRAAAQATLATLYAELGRQELLAGHGVRAAPLLAEAVRRGDRSPATPFLVARALAAQRGLIAGLGAPGVVGLEAMPDGGRWMVATAAHEVLMWQAGARAPLWRVTDARAIGDTQATVAPDARVVAMTRGADVALVDAATGADLAVLVRPGPATTVAPVQLTIDYGGARLAVLRADGTVDLWALPTRAFERTIAVAQGRATAQLDPRGERLLVFGDDGATLWDATTGAALGALAPPPCELAFFAPDGESAMVETSALDQDHDALAVVALDTRAVRRSIALPTSGLIAPSADGAWLALGADDGSVTILRVADGATLRRFEIGGQPYYLQPSPDGTVLAVGTPEGDVALFDVATGRPLARHAGGDHPRALVFSPDGAQLGIGTASGGVTVWDARAAETRWLAPAGDRMRRVAFAPDGRLVAVASDDGALSLRDPSTGAITRALSPAGGAAIDALAWSRDGHRLVAGRRDQVASVWAVDGAAPPILLRGHTGKIVAAAFAPDGARVATAGDRAVRVWDAATGALLYTAPPRDADLHALAWTSDGRTILAADDRAAVVALDAAAGAPVAAIAATGAFAAELAVSPSGRSVVFGSGAAALSIYDARTLQARVTLADATPSTIFHLAFSADEARVAATGLDGVLRIWDARTGALARVIQLGEAGNGVAWSPDGTLIATGGDDHELTIWDPISGRRLAHQPFADAVEDVAFSPRGDQLAATWLGNDALLWNVPTWDGDRAALDRWLGCYVPWRLDGDSVVAGPIDPSACGK